MIREKFSTAAGALKRFPAAAQTRHQKVATVMAAASLAFMASWVATPHHNKQAAVNWLADLCTSAARPMFSSPPADENSGGTVRPATSSRILSCEPLPHVPGKSITTQLVVFPPLAFSAAHRHPGSVTAVILEGTIRSQLAGTPPADYRVGETFFEPPGTLHLFAENPDPTHPAKLLATYVTDENCGPLVLPP